MATFVLMCVDKPDSLAVRMAHREAHLAYVGERRGVVRLAGPLLDEAGEMCGSLLILDVATRAEAEAFAAGDPYQIGGVFERTELKAVKLTIGAMA